jgi:4-amino-4-deoxy-L-arabinose transferase-like glycosyltransferase
VNILKEKDRTSNIIFIILLSFIFLYFYKLGSPSIWSPNEAFYAETPREMLERGDFLTPYFNYAYRFEKPPLMYWLVLPWGILFRFKEIAVRMVPAIAAVAGVLVTYWLGKTIWGNKRSGIISAAILASALDYNSAARYTSPEMLLTVLITSSLVIFYKWYISDTGNKALWHSLFYAMCGFAILTKGPVGIVLPFLIIITFFLIKRDIYGFKKFISARGILICLLISLPWYLFMIYKYGSAFYSVIFEENLTRFLSRKSGTSQFFFYFSVLPWNFFPGSIFIIPALLWLRKIKKDHLLFPLVWLTVVFIVFSLSKSKLPTYIYPLFSPLAIIIGGWINTAIDENSGQGRILSWLSPVILLVIITGLFWIKSYLPAINLFIIGLLIFLFLWSIWNIKKRTSYISLTLCLTGMSIFYFIFLTDVMPQIEKYRPYRELAALVKSADPYKKATFYCFKGHQNSLTFYLGRKIIRIKGEDKLNNLLSTDKDAFFLLEKNCRENLLLHGKKVIWEGLFYHRSESRFMVFLLDIKKNKVKEYILIK